MDIRLARLSVAFGSNVPWWWRFAYLIPDVFRHHPELQDGFVKALEGQDKALNTVIESHVRAYIEKGTMPPEGIAAPILNIAEDVAAGRQVTIRAGDYIALQNFARARK